MLKDTFGQLVFNDAVMASRLPRETYEEYLRCLNTDAELSPEAADVIANAMKDWALEKGATHFTHWFQPMTGVTAEKHEGFIAPVAGGGVMTEFSGKELIKGEPDASSFPSGGLRATFEARGYTNWDPSSYAFIKDGVLCIPTAFCSYTGEALDKKTPLLRSMEAIDKEAKRLLRALGITDVKKIYTTVGAEQEYFLIAKEDFEKRKDLRFTGRTLFGARPPKGQDLEDHYFGPVKPRVAAYMRDLDEELWRLGVPAKTRHNETAPSQHESAPVFETANIATDHNQLTMEVMKRVAAKHGLVCLLHEKPFAGVSGSGKHNNWSLSTDTGVNLLSPGPNPYTNTRFLLFLAAVIKGVDEYGDLMRISIASAGNDHRLGGHEAPPAIVSLFLGDDLTEMLKCIAENRPYASVGGAKIETGVHILPRFEKDTSDRNRTSPFAFTGNKFEFRMPGASMSVSEPTLILNTIVADALQGFAEEIENSRDISSAVRKIISETVSEHGKVIFNGNNYSAEWIEEAKMRGLPNYKNTAEALPHLTDEKNIGLFVRHGIFTSSEIHSRLEIYLENYCKTVSIEALTMLDMARQEILPAIAKFAGALAAAGKDISASGVESPLKKDLEHLCKLYRDGSERVENLENALFAAHARGFGQAAARLYAEQVLGAMRDLRVVADEAELSVAADYWPFPAYDKILFDVN